MAAGQCVASLGSDTGAILLVGDFPHSTNLGGISNTMGHNQDNAGHLKHARARGLMLQCTGQATLVGCWFSDTHGAVQSWICSAEYNTMISPEP